MSNMSYCRFRNTYTDLKECEEYLDDDFSEEELEYRTKLLKLCKRITDRYEGET